MIAADPGYVPQHDAFDYDRHADSIAAGEGFPVSGYAPGGGESALRSPGYPYLLAATYAVTGVDADGGRLLGAVAGALLALLCFLVASRIWGRRTGIIAGALTALFPPLVLLSRELFSETVFASLVLAAVLTTLEYRAHGGRRLRWAALAGAVCGLAALTRNPGIVLIVPIMLGAWVGERRLTLRALMGPGVVFLVAAVVIAPWTIRNATEFGRFIPIATATGFGLAGTYNETSRTDPEFPSSWRAPNRIPDFEAVFQAPGVDEGTLDAELRSEALDHASDHPAYVFEVIGANLRRMLLIEEDSVVDGGTEVADRGIGSGSSGIERVSLLLVIPLAGIGILVLMKGRVQTPAGEVRRPRGPLFMWLIPILLVAVALPVAGLPRYRVPADPFMLMLAAVAIERALTLLGGRIRARRIAGVATVAVLAVALVGGCGGGNGETQPAQPGDPSTGAGASSGLPEYIARADRICAQALRESRQISRRALDAGDAGSDGLEFTTELLIAPGLKSRRNQRRKLEALEVPADAPPELRTYLDLFPPLEELIVQRLEAGRDNDLERSLELETLMVNLADEQNQAAAAVGFDECSVDVLTDALQ